MASRRGRPPHPEPVTPAEARVLELVREGMPNAEIAVRLGLSVNTVKYHVSNLLAKAGVTDRAELRDARLDARPRTRRLRAFLPTLPLWLKLVGGAAAATVMGLGAVTYFAADSSPTDDTFSSNNVPIPDGYERPSAAELTARGMLDAGPFFTSPNAVAGIQIRGDMTVVASTAGATLVMGGNDSPWERAASGQSGVNVAEIDAVGEVAGQMYSLVVGGGATAHSRRPTQPAATRPPSATTSSCPLPPAIRRRSSSTPPVTRIDWQGSSRSPRMATSSSPRHRTTPRASQIELLGE
jgi:DNA-binding CsgD family transcriptional regulator